MENKSKYAVFNYSHSARNIQRKALQDFCKDLNSVTADKFRIISNWFNKPSIASPATDLALLFNAVVSEIKGFFNDFSPNISTDSEKFTISGGLYFNIYDALFILIYNVARYGKKNGTLSMKIEMLKEIKAINISIISEVENEKELIESEKLINIALNSDCEDAHITEGRSGLKKLKRMEKDKYINDVNYKFDGNKIIASFKFSMDF